MNFPKYIPIFLQYLTLSPTSSILSFSLSLYNILLYIHTYTDATIYSLQNSHLSLSKPSLTSTSLTQPTAPLASNF